MPLSPFQKLQEGVNIEGSVQVSKLSESRPAHWAACVATARLKFEKYFNHKVSTRPPHTHTHIAKQDGPRFIVCGCPVPFGILSALPPPSIVFCCFTTNNRDFCWKLMFAQRGQSVLLTDISLSSAHPCFRTCLSSVRISENLLCLHVSFRCRRSICCTRFLWTHS